MLEGDEPQQPELELLGQGRVGRGVIDLGALLGETTGLDGVEAQDAHHSFVDARHIGDEVPGIFAVTATTLDLGLKFVTRFCPQSRKIDIRHQVPFHPVSTLRHRVRAFS